MPTTHTTITLGGQPCVISHAGLPTACQKANSYTCPLGPKHGTAWVLMLKKHIDKLEDQAVEKWDLVLRNIDNNGSPQVRTVKDLYWMCAERVLPGGSTDSNALYLCQLADKRILLERYNHTNTLQYNVRSFAADEKYLSNTCAASDTAWTWAEVLEKLWDALASDFAGAWPGLPSGYTPGGVPENVQFFYQNAWAAFHEISKSTGITTAYDPTDGTFSLVRLGAPQTSGTLPTPAWDAQFVNPTAGGKSIDEPSSLHAFFNVHHRSYGQEADTGVTNQWITDIPDGGTHRGPVSHKAEALDTNAISSTVLGLWDSLPHVLDEDNDDDNSANRVTVTTRHADNIELDVQTAKVHKRYTGIIDIVPGSKIKLVCWSHDYERGTLTEIWGAPGLLDSFVFEQGILQATFNPLHELFAPPDLTRATFPNYPRVANIVRVWDSGEDAGDLVQANADDLHPGQVRRWAAGTMATLEDCWILFVDDFGNKSGDIPAINGDYYGPGRLSGIETSGGTTKPLYTVHRGHRLLARFIRFALPSALADTDASKASCTVDDYWDGANPGATVTVYNPNASSNYIFSGDSGAKGIAVYDDDDDKYWIIQMEC